LQWQGGEGGVWLWCVVLCPCPRPRPPACAPSHPWLAELGRCPTWLQQQGRGARLNQNPLSPIRPTGQDSNLALEDAADLAAFVQVGGAAPPQVPPWPGQERMLLPPSQTGRLLAHDAPF